MGIEWECFLVSALMPAGETLHPLAGLDMVAIGAWLRFKAIQLGALWLNQRLVVYMLLQSILARKELHALGRCCHSEGLAEFEFEHRKFCLNFLVLVC